MRMPSLSLGRWTGSCQRRFHSWWHSDRVYLKGYIWTPLILVQRLDKVCECCNDGGG
jgi:hypothetical protein